MKATVTVSITVDDVSDLANLEEMLGGLSKGGGKKPSDKAAAGGKTPQQKAAETRKKKAEEAKKAKSAEADLLGEEGGGDAPSLDDVKGAVRTYIAANSIEEAKAIFGEFGASKLSEVGEEHYADLMAKLQE